ncbi:MAG: hypothetical protein ACXV5Q_07845 [Frankiaceae bacterium]
MPSEVPDPLAATDVADENALCAAARTWLADWVCNAALDGDVDAGVPVGADEEAGALGVEGVLDPQAVKAIMVAPTGISISLRMRNPRLSAP